MGNSKINLLYLGGLEGFGAPIVEGLFTLVVSKFIDVFSQTGNQFQITFGGGITIYFSYLLVMFTVIILFENIAIGLFGDTWFAFGYCIGAILAILVYANILKNIFPKDMASMVIVIIIGMIVRLFISYKFERKREKDSNWDSNW